MATSTALAKALEREGADLILFGQQANDSDGAVLWAAVADRLRLPVVSQAAEITHADGKQEVAQIRVVDKKYLTQHITVAADQADLPKEQIAHTSGRFVCSNPGRILPNTPIRLFRMPALTPTRPWIRPPLIRSPS